MDVDSPIAYRKISSIMREIGVQSMWMGFLPVGMIAQQSHHYQMIGSRRCGEKWGEQFVGKMLRATLQLWLHRNGMLHASSENGIAGMDLILLRNTVEKQLKLGKGLMDADDWCLLDVNIHDLMAEPVDSIRGWLCDILIARGDIEAAKEEGLRDRRGASAQSTQITYKQHKAFLDWRNVHLH